MSTLSPVHSQPFSSASSEELRRATALASAEHTDKTNSDSANEQSFSFSDFLSIINPLQHIPVVGSIYRAITGDTIKPAARVIGGMLFGGPAGLVTSAFNAMVEQTKGKDLGEQAIALVLPDKSAPSPTEPAPQFAAVTEPQPPADANSPAAVQPMVAEDNPISPASAPRGFLSRNPPPGMVNAFAPDRTLGGSLLRGPNAPTNGAAAQPGRTIADYRSFSGRPLPVVDTSRTAPSQSAQIRLQPSVPLAERPRFQPETSPSSREGAAAEPAVAAPTETVGTGTPQAPANDWFTAAMSRGLDRYREQHRQSAPIRIDTSL